METQTFCVVFKDVGREASGDSRGLNSVLFDVVLQAGVNLESYSSTGARESFALYDLPGGEWSALLRSGELFVATSDDSGFSPLFYASVDVDGGKEDLYVSNSFGAIAAELRAASLTPQLDEVYAATLLGTDATLGQTSFSETTPDRRIKLLEFDQLIAISPNGWSIQKRPRLEDGSTYESLLQRGIDRSVRSLQDLARGFGRESMQLRLSGGKDSRAVLALMAKADVLGDVSIFTVDVGKAQSDFAKRILDADLRIAAYLQTITGTKWSRPGTSYGFAREPHENLGGWQKYRSNYNFHFLPRANATVRESMLFDVYGGGGEVYRTQWAPYFLSLPALEDSPWGDPSKQDAIARLAFRSHYVPRRFERGLYELAEDRFVKELCLEQNEDFLEAIDNHYIRFRNRSHNGSARSGACSNVFNVLPLAQPEFRLAAAELTREDRRDGRLIFDLIERTAPELNQIEFQSGSWPERFGKVQSINPQSPDLSEYRESQRSPGSIRWIEDPLKWNAEDLTRWADLQFHQIKAELRDVEGFSAYFSDRISTELSDRFSKQNTAGKGGLIAKLASLRDAVDGPQADVVAQYQVRDGKFCALFAGRNAYKPKPRWFRESLKPVELSVHPRRNANSLEVQAAVISGDAENVEYAFYLHCGSALIDSVWYQRQGFFSRPLPEATDGPLRITVFARFRGSKDAFAKETISLEAG